MTRFLQIFLLGVGIMLSAMTTAWAQINFAAGTDYTVGTNPNSVFSADFDGDGYKDLAVANGNSNTVSILKNNGNGTFATKVDYTTDTNPVNIAASDLDGDGDIDLAITNWQSTTVSILKNNGNGTFAAKVDYTVGSQPYGIVSADLDGDGDQDLAITRNGNFSTTVCILKNNGNGTFASSVDYTSGSNPYFLVASDLDADGDQDLVTANYDSNTISVLKNNGDATFAVKVDYATGVYPRSLVSADLDNDGDKDIAVVSSNDFTLSIFKNNGNGTFAAKVDYVTESYPTVVSSGDFDSDGKIDLAVSNAGVLSVFKNTGNAVFSPKVDFNRGSGFLFMADIDNDNDLDALITNWIDGKITVSKNTTPPSNFNILSFTPTRNALHQANNVTISATLSAAVNASTLNFNNAKIYGSQTGFYTAGAWTGGGTSTISYTPTSYLFKKGETITVEFTTALKSTTGLSFTSTHQYQFTAQATGGTGVFASAVSYSTYVDAFNPQFVYGSDINNDNYVDLFAGGWGTTNLSLFKNSNDGFFANRIDYQILNNGGSAYPMGQTYPITSADFDNDGDNDVVVVQYNHDMSLLNNVHGVFSSSVKNILSGGALLFAVISLDVNGDGNADLIVSYSKNSVGGVLVMANDGNANFVSIGTYQTVDESPYSVYSADLDEDGDLDLIVPNNNSNNLSVFINNGYGVFSVRNDYLTGNRPRFACAIDIDNDGDMDIVSANHLSGTISILKNNGNATFNTKIDYSVGNSPHFVGGADFDADGNMDIFVVNRADATISILKNDGSGNFFSKTNYSVGATPISAFAADFDNDGAIDLAVANSASNTISILKNISSYTQEETVTSIFLSLLDPATKTAYLANPSSFSFPADQFQVPFTDLYGAGLTDGSRRHAKILSYLEFQDGVSVLNRNKINFSPTQTVKKAEFLKILLEAWRIDVSSVTGASPFTDVLSTHEYFKYIKKAHDLGIISGSGDFFPNYECPKTFADACITAIAGVATRPILADLQNPINYFTPLNFTPETANNERGSEQGVNKIMEEAFSIPDVGFSVDFEHFHSSENYELPAEYFPIEPLGKGWRHTYNGYIIETEESRLMNGTVISPSQLIVCWQDNKIHFYDNHPTTPVIRTADVYDEITRPTADEIRITNKEQVTAVFSRRGAGTKLFVLSQLIDANGNTMTINYASATSTQIVSVTSASSQNITFTYNVDNLLTKVTDPTGRFVEFTYNADKLLASYKDMDGKITSYSYDTKKRLNTYTPAAGTALNYTFNTDHKLTQIQDGGSIVNINPPQIVNLSADHHSQSFITVMGSQNRAFEHRFSKNGLLTRFIGNAVDVQITYGNTGINRFKPSQVLINGSTFAFTYDLKGNVTQISRNGGAKVESFTYNLLNKLTQYINPRGKATNFAYDVKGNLTQIIDALGKITTFTRNSKGQVTKITNPENIETTFAYDSKGNQTSASIPVLGITTSKTFTAQGWLKTFVDAKGKTTTLDYDSKGRPIKETDPKGNATQMEYDEVDNPTKITNAKGGQTTIGYDAQKRPISTAFAGFTALRTYLPEGLIDKITKPSGLQLVHTYDLAGRLKSNGYITNINYDSRSNPIAITNANGTITMTYDAFDRMISHTDYFGNAVAYEYDLNDNRTKITYPTGKTAVYDYDDKDRLVTVKWEGNTAVAYTYFHDDRIKQETRGNGTKTLYAYDAGGRPTGLHHTKTDNSTIAKYDFVLDKNGNIVSETIVSPFGALPTFTSANIPYVVNAGNRITTMNPNGFTTAFTHDADGNVTVKGTWAFTHNIINRTTGISEGSNTNTYDYCGMGFLRNANRNGVTTRYVLDILGMENVLVETDGSNTPKHFYLHGLGMIARIKADGTIHYYHHDYRGSTVALSNAAEAITHKYAYGIHGEVKQIVEADENLYRYVGKYGVRYETAQHYFMRARFYDHTIARFLAEDPIWAANLYPYAGNNPIMGIDIDGHRIIKAKTLQNASRIAQNIKTAYNTYDNVKGGVDFSKLPHSSSLGKDISGTVGGYIGSNYGGKYGAVAGAKVGAILGSYVPIVGTLAGAIVGGAVGYALGNWAGGEIGEKVGKKAYDLATKKNVVTVTAPNYNPPNLKDPKYKPVNRKR